MSESVVELDAVGKRFGQRAALQQISLTLRAGERLLLLGPNGAGKSTLLLLIGGLLRADGGRCRILGESGTRRSLAGRARLGFLGHSGCLDDALTARENLMFYARLYGLQGGAARSAELLAKVGLTDRADEKLRSFSRGMRQRVALARAMLHRPRLLLLDEPTNGLDGASQSVLVELILREFGAPGCLVAATHDLAFARRLATRVVVLRAGRQVLEAGAGDLAAPRDAWDRIEAALEERA